MDNTEVITDLIGQLGGNLDNLQDVLGSLINTSLSETAKKLPLLDRAKLYVLATYAIESVVFSFLRLNGTSAREHPVYRELARVKQYFEKVKLAESGDKRPNLRLDQAAAGRIIKHALSQQVSKVPEQSARLNRFQDPLSTGQIPSRKRKSDELEDQEPAPEAPGVSLATQNAPSGSRVDVNALDAALLSSSAKPKVQDGFAPESTIGAKDSANESSSVKGEPSVPEVETEPLRASDDLKRDEQGPAKSIDDTQQALKSSKHKKAKKEKGTDAASSETHEDKPKKKKRKKSKKSKGETSN